MRGEWGHAKAVVVIVDEKLLSCHLPIFTDNMKHNKTTIVLHSLIQVMSTRAVQIATYTESGGGLKTIT